jgi:Zn-dependent M28 family amino/carboxypeptidase
MRRANVFEGSATFFSTFALAGTLFFAPSPLRAGEDGNPAPTANTANSEAPAAPAAAPAPPTPANRDPEIEKLLARISANRIECSVEALVGFQTRHTLSDIDDPRAGIGAARKWLQGELEEIARNSGGRLKVEADRFRLPASPPRIFRAVEVVNLVATLPGSQAEARDRVYVICAHYDSRAAGINDPDSPAPGADDNASGTAAVLELARVFSRQTFDATIVFLLVAGEEQGLLGSHHWVEQAKSHGLRIAGVINNNVIGSPRGEDGKLHRNQVRLFAEGVPPHQTLTGPILTQLRTGGENDFPPRQLARAIKTAAELYLPQFTVQLVYRSDRYLRQGDQNSFLEAGYPAVRLTEAAENYAHQHQDTEIVDGVQYGDLAMYLDFNYIADVARVNAAAVAGLALAPAAPAGVQVETALLENDTRLSWQPGPEPDLAGYRVVWRESTSPSWENHLDVGRVTEVVLKGLTKDNMIFGVQSVDTAGHASPAVYPRPLQQDP